jgi:hypothetical protein
MAQEHGGGEKTGSLLAAMCQSELKHGCNKTITMISLQPAICLCVLLLAKTAHGVGHGNVQLSSAVDDSLKR